WLYKWIEAAACVYRVTGDAWIAARMDESIALIAQAQEKDGYIATQITATGKPRFQEPREHEVYNMGHLLTAACIHKRMTGKDTFLKIAVRTGDFLCETLGVSVSPSYAHNPSAIMGLVELYRQTGRRKYLECAKRIVDGRGAHPKHGGVYSKQPGIAGTDQIQDRIPLRRATEVVGHNVFFTYLYAGAADVYLEMGDKTLLPPLERLWEDLAQRKICINGGVSPMGSGVSLRKDIVGEAVGPAYFLPSADAYNETCGQIGNFMWNYRMLCISKDARYADMMELELYNGFMAGIGLDGKSWFYRNALRRYDAEHVESGHNDLAQRVLPGRKRICCPTNLLRTFAQLQAYLYSIDEDGLWVHHFGGNVLDGKLADGSNLKLTQETQYPWDGKVVLKMNSVGASEPFAVRLRIPGWAKGAVVQVNGKAPANPPAAGRYLFMKRAWKAGDVIELDLPMEPRLMQAHPKAEQLRNQVAVMRGPILYCLESADLPDDIDLNNVYLPDDLSLRPVSQSIESLGMRTLKGDALYRPEAPWTTDLYRPMTNSALKPLLVRMIPYFAWNNRGPAAMSVWLPVILRD
ncbi:MAG: glycoside hydrolase family 127 protein, partial [Planctomycetes bacterium]|nr:glycoside hydrolase family 127 protein [Planctomycetota bacterium]